MITFLKLLAVPSAVTLALPMGGGDVQHGDRVMAQAPPRPFDSRPATGPPTPAPRSSSGGTVILPRVPTENRIDRSRRYVPDRPLRLAPESQRVVPKPPGAGGDPAKFFDKPAENPISCEQLRRLAVRTARLYWQNRYARCIGAN
jgi:hypothetical protein